LENTKRFRAFVLTPISGSVISPCQLQRYDPPILLKVDIEAFVVEGESWSICTGVRSKVVSAGILSLVFGIAKVVYYAEVLEIKITPQ
jgi:hypothetical protein